MKKAIQIDEKDNVATVTGQAIDGEPLEILNPDGAVILQTKTSEDLPFGHKIAIKDIGRGVNVVKYGEVDRGCFTKHPGRAMGSHTQRQECAPGHLGTIGGYSVTEFYGYERPDGTVGTRNHLLVIAPIDCSYCRRGESPRF